MNAPHKVSFCNPASRIAGFESERSSRDPTLELAAEAPIPTQKIAVDSTDADRRALLENRARTNLDACRSAHFAMAQNRDVPVEDAAAFIGRLKRGASRARTEEQVDAYRNLAQYWALQLIRSGAGDDPRVHTSIRSPRGVRPRRVRPAPLFHTPTHSALQARHRELLQQRGADQAPTAQDINAFLDTIVARFSELTEGEQSQMRHYATYWNNTQGRMTHEWRELDEIY